MPWDPATDPRYEKVWCEWCRNWRFRVHAEKHDKAARAEQAEAKKRRDRKAVPSDP